jgi:hypothetical protein
MTKTAFCVAIGAAAALFAANAATAAVAFQSDFSTFANGNLVGQSGWTQFGSATSNPIQVNNGRAIVPGLATGSGDRQDAQRTFTAIPNTANTTIYAGATLTVDSVLALNSSTSGSSFFMALATTDSSPFTNFRVVARQGTAAGTYQIGIRPTGQSANSVAFGSDLTLGTPINLILAWDFISGGTNDEIFAYVNPTSLDRNSNPAYASGVNAGTDAPGFGSLVLSQFTSSTISQSGVRFSRATVATVFSEVASYVPAPGALGLAIAGGLVAARRRRA